MTERIIDKLDRLGAEAEIKEMTPEIRRFALLVRQDVVAGWPKRPYRPLQDNGSKYFGAWDKADEALNKMAENARELGLDYEPEQMTTTENNGGKTGWPPGLLQDDCKGLSKWLANQPDAKRRVREALAEQPPQPAVPDAIGPNEDELPAYAAGWNDCRQLMLEMRKP
jgi:hypothetical protein